MAVPNTINIHQWVAAEQSSFATPCLKWINNIWIIYKLYFPPGLLRCSLEATSHWYINKLWAGGDDPSQLSPSGPCHSHSKPRICWCRAFPIPVWAQLTVCLCNPVQFLIKEMDVPDHFQIENVQLIKRNPSESSKTAVGKQASFRALPSCVSEPQFGANWELGGMKRCLLICLSP